MSHWVQWTDEDTRLVEEALTAPVVAEIVTTIGRWTWIWPDVAATVLPARHPDFITELVARHGRDARFRRKREAHERNWLDTALHEGLFEAFRKRGPWPSPEAQDCGVCGRRFAPETLNQWMRRFGPARYCAACCCRATQGCTVGDGAHVIQTLRFATKALRCIPSQEQVRGRADLSGLDLPQRDEAMAALVCFPDPAAAAAALGVATSGKGRWLAVLQAAGVVGAAWRQARGTHTLAKDGHFCRSLGECSIDDFLSTNNIPHEPEPLWPQHQELNPLGRLRADWKLADGTLLEYAGLEGDVAYDTKIAIKQRLAIEMGIKLLVVTPPDLLFLQTVLAAYLPEIGPSV